MLLIDLTNDYLTIDFYVNNKSRYESLHKDIRFDNIQAFVWDIQDSHFNLYTHYKNQDVFLEVNEKLDPKSWNQLLDCIQSGQHLIGILENYSAEESKLTCRFYQFSAKTVSDTPLNIYYDDRIRESMDALWGKKDLSNFNNDLKTLLNQQQWQTAPKQTKTILATQYLAPGDLEQGAIFNIFISLTPPKKLKDRTKSSVIRLILKPFEEGYLIDQVASISGKGDSKYPIMPLYLSQPVNVIESTLQAQVQNSIEQERLIRNDKFWKLCENYLKAEEICLQKESEKFGEFEFEIIKPKFKHIYTILLKYNQESKRLIDYIKNNDIQDLWIETDQNSTSINFKKLKEDTHAKKIELEIESKSKLEPGSGKIKLHHKAAEVQIMRRREAFEKISKATIPIKILRFLLEGTEIPTIQRRLRTLKPQIAKINKLLNENIENSNKIELNENQAKAIEIALNTPDIAIIQGPPGTGKTTLIQAIVARLLDETVKEERIFIEDYRKLIKPVLLTSTQHIAVEHAAKKTNFFDLPTIKLGNKQKSEESTQLIANWGKEHAGKIKNALSEDQLKLIQYYTFLDDLKQKEKRYRLTPQPYSEEIEEFKTLIENVKTYLSPEVYHSFCNRLLMRTTGHNEHPALKRIRNYLQELDLDPEIFMDDGPAYAQKLLETLSTHFSDRLIEGTKQILEEAIEFEYASKAPESTFLEKLSQLKDTLIQKFQPSAEIIDQPGIPHEGIISLYQDLIQELENFEKTIPASWQKSLSRFVHTLEGNPEAVKQMVLQYSPLIATTIGQSTSKNVRKTFDLQKQTNVLFDFVIIDEAARAMPLDLMIPMTLANKKLILIGDHRQLPYMLDEIVIDEIENPEDKKNIQNLKLFEDLKNYLQKRSEKDGIQRVIMLDTQFRMHPVLGDFISKNFYEQHGDAQIHAGLTADNLVHGLKEYKDKVAIWRDFPSDQGLEQRSKSGSYYRMPEAKEVIKTLKSILFENLDCEVGVISFYSAQIQTLLDLVSKDIDLSSMLDHRFQIGTVDSFQGKEYDVVILSLTRSNRKPFDPIHQKLGFLTKPNRLNVSMSRQKSLLIVIGDLAMIPDDSEKYDTVKGLIEFKKLCQGEYGSIISL